MFVQTKAKRRISGPSTSPRYPPGAGACLWLISGRIIPAQTQISQQYLRKPFVLISRLYPVINCNTPRFFCVSRDTIRKLYSEGNRRSDAYPVFCINKIYTKPLSPWKNKHRRASYGPDLTAFSPVARKSSWFSCTISKSLRLTSREHANVRYVFWTICGCEKASMKTCISSHIDLDILGGVSNEKGSVRNITYTNVGWTNLNPLVANTRFKPQQFETRLTTVPCVTFWNNSKEQVEISLVKVELFLSLELF